MQSSDKEQNHYKLFTPEQKLLESLKLYYLARELKRASIIEFKPEITLSEIDKKIAESFLNARY